jgi:hypothetical protein
MRATNLIILLPAIALTLIVCAQTEVAKFQAREGQQTMVRDGQPAIVSRKGTSLVIVRPASRQFKAGKRPTYVAAMNNMGTGPLQFTMTNL